MFTTECPRCGRELEVGATECPHCDSVDEPKAQAAAVRPRPETRSESTPRTKPLPKSVPRPRPAGRKAAWNVPPWFSWIMAASFALIAGTAVYHLNSEWFGASNLDLEDAPEEITSVPSAIDGNLEIAGLRTWWDLETETIRVRAVAINHGETPWRGGYRVYLRSVASRPSADAVARFDLRITEALAPREARDVEAELMSLAHPSALPEWTEQRIELEMLPLEP